jgi:hypothetical protein
MTWKFKLYIIAICFSPAFFLVSQEAHAVLGGSAASIEADKKAFSAEKSSVTSPDGYSVHEMNSPGNMVREYISPSGIVFGIAWRGLVNPDLTQLLGSYASEYGTALKQTSRVKGARRLRVRTANIVVERWGHMRRFQGRAYAPALVPQGVSIDEIK